MAAILLVISSPILANANSSNDVPAKTMLRLAEPENASRWEKALADISSTWRDAYTGPVLEATYLSRGPQTPKLFALLEKKTGQKFGFDVDRWYTWLWAQEFEPYKHYGEFKKKLYRQIDGRFADYFADGRKANIRLDEIRWGGVRQNGIPPLRNPKMLKASEADYLSDDNIIFGLEVNGDARAYPKRILAWHEMFIDTIQGEDVAGVYCTLCGSMILYKTTLDGVKYDLGTSGFLYRSNKLMFDEETNSMWNTIWGTPNVGPLVGKDIKLERLSVVTTTWGEWKKRHPDTTVLSLNTGFNRNYDEGVAYNSYFATDEVMFNVPKLDNRLLNKDEVLALLIDEKPVALSNKFLRKNPLYYQDNIVIFTDASGAHRAYYSDGVKFKSWDFLETATDNKGGKWQISEAELISPDGKKLARYPSHNAFWFGWYSAYPDTVLIK